MYSLSPLFLSSRILNKSNPWELVFDCQFQIIPGVNIMILKKKNKRYITISFAFTPCCMYKHKDIKMKNKNKQRRFYLEMMARRVSWYFCLLEPKGTKYPDIHWTTNCFIMVIYSVGTIIESASTAIIVLGAILHEFHNSTLYSICFKCWIITYQSIVLTVEN